MSLLAHLANEVPRRRNSKASPLYRLAQKYRDEIEEAQRRGYTWGQICNAVKEVEGPDWNREWQAYGVQDAYRQILKEDD